MADRRSPEFNLQDVNIRLAREEDQMAVRDLFRQGLLEGQVPGGDTGADVMNLREGYFSHDGQSALWVADYHDDVIGMIGVQKMSEHEAEIRRLRVRPQYRRKGLGTKLMETALGFCRHHGYLKVVLDVRVERGPAIALFQKFGFQLNRTRESGGRKMLDFYLDIYREPLG